MRVKVWNRNDEEPDLWDINVTAATYSMGRIGFDIFMQSVAQFDNLIIEYHGPTLVAVDIKPSSCPNPLSIYSITRSVMVGLVYLGEESISSGETQFLIIVGAVILGLFF